MPSVMPWLSMRYLMVRGGRRAKMRIVRALTRIRARKVQPWSQMARALSARVINASPTYQPAL